MASAEGEQIQDSSFPWIHIHQEPGNKYKTEIPVVKSGVKLSGNEGGERESVC